MRCHLSHDRARQAAPLLRGRPVSGQMNLTTSPSPPGRLNPLRSLPFPPAAPKAAKRASCNGRYTCIVVVDRAAAPLGSWGHFLSPINCTTAHLPGACMSSSISSSAVRPCRRVFQSLSIARAASMHALLRLSVFCRNKQRARVHHIIS